MLNLKMMMVRGKELRNWEMTTKSVVGRHEGASSSGTLCSGGDGRREKSE